MAQGSRATASDAVAQGSRATASDAVAPSRGFRIALVCLGVALAVACLGIASREWFSRDDFAFLVRVRSEGGLRWSEVLWPVAERPWPFYRPLGMEAYFAACHALFGLDARGFFAVSLGFHFASGYLVQRIARQLALPAPLAWGAGFLAISRHPSLAEIFYGSVFHFVASMFLGLLAVTSFVSHLASRRRAAAWLSWLAVAAALLCNEVNALLPLVLFAAAFAAGSGGARCLRALAPHAGLVGSYLAIRFGVFAAAERSVVYEPFFGPHVVRNALALLGDVAGGGPLVTVVLAAAAATAAVVAWRARAAGDGATTLRRVLGLGAWCALSVAPFALLPYAPLRYAILLAPPLALLLAALATPAWSALGPRRIEVAVLLVCLLALPLPTLAQRWREPRGAAPEGLLRELEARPGLLQRGGRVIVLYGGDGQAQRDEAMPYRYLVYNGSVVDAVYPELPLSLRFHDLNERAPRGVLRADGTYLELLPGLVLRGIPPQRLEREIARGLLP